MPLVTPGPNSQTPLCAQRSALRRLKTLRRIPPSRVCDKRTALNPSPLRLFSGVTIPSPYPNELPLGILQLSPPTPRRLSTAMMARGGPSLRPLPAAIPATTQGESLTPPSRACGTESQDSCLPRSLSLCRAGGVHLEKTNVDARPSPYQLAAASGSAAAFASPTYRIPKSSRSLGGMFLRRGPRRSKLGEPLEPPGPLRRKRRASLAAPRARPAAWGESRHELEFSVHLLYLSLQCDHHTL